MGTRRLTVLVAALALVLAGSVTIQPALASASPATLPLTGQARIADGSVRLGGAPAAAPLSISVVLASQDPTGLTAAAHAASAHGGTPLPRSVVQARFGPAPSALQAVRSWLASSGFRVAPSVGTGLVVSATASTATAEQTFGTSVSAYRLSDGRHAIATTSTPTVPAALRSSITAVLGLNTTVRFSPGSVVHAASHGGTTGAASPQLGTVGPNTCAAVASMTNAFSAPQLQGAYGFTPMIAAGNSGFGATIALVELGQADYANSDITQYNNCYGLPNSLPTRISLSSSNPTVIPGGDVEATSDVEVARSMAPGAALQVYESQGNSNLDELNVLNAIAGSSAQVVSDSWGACEPDMGSAALSAEASVLNTMAAQGQTFVSAAGDLGSAGCASALSQSSYGADPYASQLAVMDPAGQPTVLGVGGTAITSLSTPPVESVWNESGPSSNGSGFPASTSTFPGNANSASTGGISQFWSMPAWQQGADTSGLSSTTPCATSPLLSPSTVACREVPDVSALAAAGTTAEPGYAIYGSTTSFPTPGWYSVGGTSLASPLWAALLAIAVGEQAGHTGLGTVNSTLYSLAASNPNAFNDVTTGNNNWFSNLNNTCAYPAAVSQPCYRATAGYDMATGLGTPHGATIVAALLGQSAATVTTSSLSSASVAHAYSTTLAATGTAPFTWSLQSGSLPGGLALSPSGVISGTPLSAGTTTFQVSVTDSNSGGATTGTKQLSLTVGNSATMAIGTMMMPGTNMLSANGSSRMVFMRAAGQVVIAKGNTLIWRTTNAVPATMAWITPTGRLILAAGSTSNWVWASPFPLRGVVGTSLTIQDDGELVIGSTTGPAWSSVFGPLYGGTVLPLGTIPPGTFVTSNNGAYQLHVSGGYLVLSATATPSVAIWSTQMTGIQSQPGTWAIMATSGRVQLWDDASNKVWVSQNPITMWPPVMLRVADDGHLYLRTPSYGIIWARP